MNIAPPLVRFIYNGSVHLPQWEVVISKLWSAVHKILELPQELWVVFDDLGHSVYADTKVDARFKNRVTINTCLFISDIPPVFVHEVIHVSQMHCGLLHSDPHGNMLWRNRMYRVHPDMTYSDYCKLPWEADVFSRHDSVLKQTLALATEELQNKI